jgi:hypothetical protein
MPHETQYTEGNQVSRLCLITTGDCNDSGQPAPSSPLTCWSGEHYELVKALEGNGNRVLVASAYERKEIQKTMKEALNLLKRANLCLYV